VQEGELRESVRCADGFESLVVMSMLQPSSRSAAAGLELRA
jgi:hypothetical protein